MREDKIGSVGVSIAQTISIFNTFLWLPAALLKTCAGLTSTKTDASGS